MRSTLQRVARTDPEGAFTRLVEGLNSLKKQKVDSEAAEIQRMGTDARMAPMGFYPFIRFAKHPLRRFLSYTTPVERTEGAFGRLVEG